MVDAGAFDYIKEWALTYVKHRDLSLKKIAEINGTDYGFQIINNDGTITRCIVQLSLKNLSLTIVTAAEDKTNTSNTSSTLSTFLVTLSNEENIREIYKMWGTLSTISNLLIVFVNPFSATEEKWVLKPYLHNKICDKASLLQGLKAMAELVKPIDEETLTLKVRRVIEAEANSARHAPQ